MICATFAISVAPTPTSVSIAPRLAMTNLGIWALTAAGVSRLLLDLGDVSFIDSSGIGELTRSYATVGRGDGQIKLLRLTKRIHELMAITKLLTVFEVFDDEKKAVASFGRGES